jgi:hypothetical protein
VETELQKLQLLDRALDNAVPQVQIEGDTKQLEAFNNQRLRLLRDGKISGNEWDYPSKQQPFWPRQRVHNPFMPENLSAEDRAKLKGKLTWAYIEDGLSQAVQHVIPFPNYTKLSCSNSTEVDMDMLSSPYEDDALSLHAMDTDLSSNSYEAMDLQPLALKLLPKENLNQIAEVWSAENLVTGQLERGKERGEVAKEQEGAMRPPLAVGTSNANRMKLALRRALRKSKSQQKLPDRVIAFGEKIKMMRKWRADQLSGEFAEYHLRREAAMIKSWYEMVSKAEGGIARQTEGGDSDLARGDDLHHKVVKVSNALCPATNCTKKSSLNEQQAPGTLSRDEEAPVPDDFAVEKRRSPVSKQQKQQQTVSLPEFKMLPSPVFATKDQGKVTGPDALKSVEAQMASLALPPRTPQLKAFEGQGSPSPLAFRFRDQPPSTPQLLPVERPDSPPSTPQLLPVERKGSPPMLTFGGQDPPLLTLQMSASKGHDSPPSFTFGGQHSPTLTTLTNAVKPSNNVGKGGDQEIKDGLKDKLNNVEG